MKVYITEVNKDTAVDIHCIAADENIRRPEKYIAAYGSTLSGKANGETMIVPIGEILYFESVDGRSSIPETAFLKRIKSCTSLKNSRTPPISTDAANRVSSI